MTKVARGGTPTPGRRTRSVGVLLGAIVGLRAGLHVVGEAQDGEQAISEAERLQPNVILLDLSMPRRTGRRSARDQASRARRESDRSVRVCRLDAPADVLAHGADRYIEKGADPETIANAIEHVAAQAPAGRPHP